MNNPQPIPLTLSPGARVILAMLAMAGLLGPNGWFLWKVATDFPAIQATLADPVARVFIGEAFVLMLLLASLIRAARRQPGALSFLAMSLVGGLVFSVPAWLWLASRPAAGLSDPHR